MRLDYVLALKVRPLIDATSRTLIDDTHRSRTFWSDACRLRSSNPVSPNPSTTPASSSASVISASATVSSTFLPLLSVSTPKRCVAHFYLTASAERECTAHRLCSFFALRWRSTWSGKAKASCGGGEEGRGWRRGGRRRVDSRSTPLFCSHVSCILITARVNLAWAALRVARAANVSWLEDMHLRCATRHGQASLESREATSATTRHFSSSRRLAA